MSINPPDERTILQNFLIPPSSLPSVLSKKQFRDLFPSEWRDDPAVRSLYHELQHSRNLQADAVEDSIDAEVRRGRRQQRQVARTRMRDAEGDAMEGIVEAGDIALEKDLLGPAANAPAAKQHSLETLTLEVAKAKRDVESETQALETEASELLGRIRAMVGDLSDLRYGHFSQGGAEGEGLTEEVVEGLRQLELLCREENFEYVWSMVESRGDADLLSLTDASR